MFRLCIVLHKTYNELVYGQLGLGMIEGIPESIWWIAYNQLIPFPDSGAEAGIVAAVVANAIGGNKKAPKDFMLPRWSPRTRPDGNKLAKQFRRQAERINRQRTK